MKYVKIALLTTCIMLLALGVGGFFVYKNYSAQQEAEKKMEQQELDMDLYGVEKESVADDTVLPLSMSGSGKNVKTYPVKSGKKIYSAAYSKKIRNKLDQLVERGNYSIDEPLWVYNPFGTNELSLYLYFESPNIKKVRYTIHVENDEIPDFTRTLKKTDALLNSTKHEYQITGLVPGVENFIILRGLDDSGKETKRVVYRITMKNIKGSIQAALTSIDGGSMEQMSNGLFFFLGNDSDNKKMPSKILLYDNSGILRGSLPLINDRCVHVMELNGNLFYNCGKNKFAEVNALGQVLKTRTVKGYRIVNDYTYDGYGSIYAIATKNGAKAIENRVIALNLTSGAAEEILNMDQLLASQKKKAKKPRKTKQLDWIGLNSIEYTGNDGLILSSRELSGIIKVAYINSVKPKIQFIIGDGDLLKELGIKKKYRPKTSKELAKEEREAAASGANKEDNGASAQGAAGEEDKTASATGIVADPESEVFQAQFGQSDVSLSVTSANTPQRYQLVLFDNAYGNTPTRKDVNWRNWPNVASKQRKKSTSMVYRYQVNEDEGTFRLANSFQVPFSSYESSVQEFERHYVVNSGSNCSVSEFDENGNLIKQLKYNVETYTYKVEKYNMKNFWYE